MFQLTQASVPVWVLGPTEPMQIDDENGNTQWRDSEVLELSQINKYDTFINKGKGYDPSPGYKQIKVHFVYAVKHDG